MIQHRSWVLRRLLPLVVAAALLGSCGDDGDDAADTGDSGAGVPGAAGSNSPGAEPPVMSIVTPPGSADDGFSGARTDVGTLECTFGDGKWQVSGQVTNPTSGAATYRIYLAFTDDAGATRGLLEIGAADVAPGATSDFGGQLDLDVDGLRCVPRIERIAA